MIIPTDAKEIEVKDSTVSFYKFENIYYFDTSQTAVPEPMINAIAGLKLLDENSKLVMINHKIPMGLFPKIEAFFDYEVEESEDFVKVTFSKKKEIITNLDNIDSNCQG
ncbi:MAG: hypothetical protein AB7D41_00955 [Arcobacter sp.]|uniref:hypothetical protein n=1 Tax=Arcobacter sp. TaxID=1872629 RepID=UPI003D01AB60